MRDTDKEPPGSKISGGFFINPFYEVSSSIVDVPSPIVDVLTRIIGVS
ncbi:MAG: hypothetical protein ABI850_17075 [Flavobacterium sp.]